MNRNELLKRTRSLSIDHGNGKLEIVLFSDEDKAEVERKVNHALGRGKTVTRAGKRLWRRDIPICDSAKAGSEAYTWDRSGNKILCRRVLFTQHTPLGDIIQEERGRVFRAFDSVT